MLSFENLINDGIKIVSIHADFNGLLVPIGEVVYSRVLSDECTGVLLLQTQMWWRKLPTCSGLRDHVRQLRIL